MSDPALPFELGVVRLSNHAFEGSNNAYLLGTESGADTTLVDTGIAMPDARDELQAGLADFGVGFADIDRILLTHWHGDHVGLAGEIQNAGGAAVHIHEADAGIVAGDPDAREAMDDRMGGLLRDWGMPEEKQAELRAFLDAGDGQELYPEVTTFMGGDRFNLGSVELEAVHLPGHTAGLTGFAFDGRDGEELFSGDALLPYYTPNVGGADTRVERPLEQYIDALAGIHTRGYTRAWPGHRGPIIDPPGRARDIVTHHRERTGRVVDRLREGPKDAWTVSAELFGSLSNIHILHGPGEAYAHLEHLREAGIVEREGAPWTYALVDRDADLDALFPVLSERDPASLPGPQ